MADYKYDQKVTQNGSQDMNQSQPDSTQSGNRPLVSIPAMSQWAKVEKNQSILRQMQLFYQNYFPMEVRYFLCQWIEEQQWSNIDHTDANYIPCSQNLIQEMLELLRQKIAELGSGEFFLIRVQLEQSVQRLENMAKTNPLELVKIIKECLDTEQSLIQEAEMAEQQQHMNQTMAGAEQPDISDQIMNEIQNLLQKTKSAEHDSKTTQQHQEAFILRFSDSQRATAQLQQIQQRPMSVERQQAEAAVKAEKEKIDQHLAQLAQDLLQMRINLSHKYQETINALQELQKQILDTELIAWKRRQQLAGNGLVVNSSSLETLQHWCESLADLIWQNRQQIKKSTTQQQQLPIKYPDGEEDILPKLNDTITGLLSSLVTSTFIVEQQPPQVLKKDARFGAVVRLLVGGKLNVHMNPPRVTATIISENQAKDLLRNDSKVTTDTSGEILNNVGQMEYQSSNGQLSINFRNMQLKKIKRADKKGSESNTQKKKEKKGNNSIAPAAQEASVAVTEEKFCIFFQSGFGVGGDELVFQVWTLSLPVVVTVHGNQECNATATVLWDNAFAEPGRIPFTVPDQVEWRQLADQLNMKFMSNTGKGLTDTNLSYIASKLFGSKDPNTCMVTWSMFNKDTLPSKPFTFWEWFYAIQKLTKEHLKELWTNDAIIGFVSKDRARESLISCPLGTFLLRFSDSELGGITIAWTGDTGGGIEVWNLAPFTSKDFNIRCLADRIKDLPSLMYLYPDKQKDAVFSQYYSVTREPPMRNDGYIHPELKTTIPEKFNPINDMEAISQPFSPDQPLCESNPSSVQTNLDELPMTPLGISQDMADLGINVTDYVPDDIDQRDLAISVEQLLATHNFS